MVTGSGLEQECEGVSQMGQAEQEGRVLREGGEEKAPWECPISNTDVPQSPIAQRPEGYRYPATLHPVSSPLEAEMDNSAHSPGCGAV